MTQLEFVKKMIKDIPEDLWSNKNAKILDPANGVGPFPFMCVFFFMKGLENQIPNTQERFKHIVENIIHVCEIQSKNMFLWICLIDIFDEYDINIFWGSFLEEGFDYHMKNIWKVNKFDLIIGNPPYQKKDGGHGASAIPLYNLFTEKSIEISTKTMFVMPSRWTAGGRDLDDFRKKMKDSDKIVFLNHFEKTKEIFGEEVEIKGGISYFLYDNNYKGNCLLNNSLVNLKEHDIIVLNNSANNLINKISSYKNVCSLITTCSYFGLDFRGNNKFIYEDSKLDTNYYKCYVSKQKGFEKWVKLDNIKNKEGLNYYRVITPRAATKGGEGLGNIFLGEKNESHSDAYISFWFNSKSESESMYSYMNTKFFNYFLILRKITQDIKTDTFKWIPLIPFDREWTDEKLFEYFKLTEEEKELILN